MTPGIVDGRVLLVTVALLVALVVWAAGHIRRANAARALEPVESVMPPGVGPLPAPAPTLAAHYAAMCRVGRHPFLVPVATVSDMLAAVTDPDPICPQHRAVLHALDAELTEGEVGGP